MQRIVVVGGGITGLLVSHILGDDVTVVDRDVPPRNSMSSLWNVMPPLCGDLRKECEESAQEYVKLSEELGVRVFWKDIIRVPPKGDRVLTSRETAEIEPCLHHESEVLGKGLHVNGEDLLKKLNSVVKRVRVTSLEVEGNSVTGLKTDEGMIRADVYVLAVGNDPEGILSNLRVSSYKGHIVKTSPLGIRNILMLEDRLGVEGDSYALLNGDSYPSSNPGVEMNQVERTIEVFRRYTGKVIHPLEIRVGFRAVTAESPLIKKIYDNAIVATGHRFGWAMAPILARKVKSLIEA
ncbi:D-amino acid dehydrogenase [Metallosphaera sp. J1]|uniref:NAD(P)/FAD-dependent oxidoreductase n=1 Tax=Metallosphaera TaxID=41980 RepID=UPI001EDCFAB5|nr:FAD-dependent oxidoreductase [Metallosphaera javensis (ex Hofmann et al. 2022)]MCG3109235.1 D-amino acid dehydrogenase [Metallosphaera javensis (ex Hofmann et al. 2022)]BCS92939.1 MAG: D-amino acid dehydrogenase [Metallosphaera javensis (ex Sakai et al. 2022)]